MPQPLNKFISELRRRWKNNKTKISCPCGSELQFGSDPEKTQVTREAFIENHEFCLRHLPEEKLRS